MSSSASVCCKQKEREPLEAAGGMWNTLGQAATVAQLVGADVGGLISMIIQAAVTAQQNKKECEQVARRVFTIGELLAHLQDPEVLRRPELQRPLAGLGDTLREAHEVVVACQGKSAVYRLVLAGRQAERFRDLQSRIDSYLLLFPVISHLDITRRLDRIYNVLVPNDTAAGPSAPAFSLPQTDDSQQSRYLYEDGIETDGKEEPHGVQEFTFEELANATNNFADDKMIGYGGFGYVYMGRLPDGREVAIKRRRPSDWGMEELKAEVTILRSVSHKNIVRLFGYHYAQHEKRRLFRKRRIDEEMVIVYEYLENRSLERCLLDQASQSPVMVSWKMRMDILLGVSRAIEYLQSYAELPVIHRDVKLSNILLDACWAPRLTDFGLAVTWEGPDHVMDAVVGAMGYLAPEYFATQTLNVTTDVYSFGVVMLQVLTGKKPYSGGEKWEENKRDTCEKEEKRQVRQEEEREACEEVDRPRSLVEFTVPLIEAGEVWKVLDMRPAAKPTSRQLEAVELVAQAAVRCVRLDWKARPSISEVVATLEAALELTRADG